jgi:hypothetical protein
MVVQLTNGIPTGRYQMNSTSLTDCLDICSRFDSCEQVYAEDMDEMSSVVDIGVRATMACNPLNMN